MGDVLQAGMSVYVSVSIRKRGMQRCSHDVRLCKHIRHTHQRMQTCQSTRVQAYRPTHMFNTHEGSLTEESHNTRTCMYTHVAAPSTCMPTHENVHTFIYSQASACMCEHVSVNTCVCICVCACEDVYEWVRVCVNVSVQ